MFAHGKMHIFMYNSKSQNTCAIIFSKSNNQSVKINDDTHPINKRELRRNRIPFICNFFFLNFLFTTNIHFIANSQRK